jgi:hypothetical protein
MEKTLLKILATNGGTKPSQRGAGFAFLPFDTP